MLPIGILKAIKLLGKPEEQQNHSQPEHPPVCGAGHRGGGAHHHLCGAGGEGEMLSVSSLPSMCVTVTAAFPICL